MQFNKLLSTAALLVLAHIPAFVSREQPEEFDVQRDELSASLLYFATGGGTFGAMGDGFGGGA